MGKLLFRNRLDVDPIPTAVTWTQQSVSSPWPGYTGWHQPLYDAVSGQILVLTTISDAASGIYFTDAFAYQTLTNTWTHLGGTGELVSLCTDNTLHWPGSRHPYWQTAIDTRRNKYMLFGGVCAGGVRQDMWAYTLSATPTANEWNEVTIATVPDANLGACLVYVPGTDVYFLYGTDGGSQTHNHWIYGPTDLNPIPGTLTAAQIAAGCATADDWTDISSGKSPRPGAVAYPGMVYLPTQQQVLLYGGETGSSTTKYNETWWYDVAAQTWTQKALSTTPPPVYNGPGAAWPGLAINADREWVFFHQTDNTGAPQTWVYRPSSDAWTTLAMTGTGPTNECSLTWDANARRLVTWSINSGNGKPDIWVGTVS